MSCDYHYNIEELKTIQNKKHRIKFEQYEHKLGHCLSVKIDPKQMIDIEKLYEKLDAINQLQNFIKAMADIIFSQELEDIIGNIDVYLFDKYVWVEIEPLEDTTIKRRLFGKNYQNVSFLRKMGSSLSGKTGFYHIIQFKGQGNESKSGNSRKSFKRGNQRESYNQY